MLNEPLTIISYISKNYPRAYLLGVFLSRLLGLVALLPAALFLPYKIISVLFWGSVSSEVKLILFGVLWTSLTPTYFVLWAVFISRLNLYSNTGYIIYDNKVSAISALKNTKITIHETRAPSFSIEIYSNGDFEATLPTSNKNFELAGCFKNIELMHNYAKITSPNQIETLKAPNLKEFTPCSQVMRHCKNAILPKLIHLPSYIFKSCQNLKLSASNVKSISYSAFEDCIFHPDSILDLPKLNEVSHNAFKKASNLRLSTSSYHFEANTSSFFNSKHTRLSLNNLTTLGKANFKNCELDTLEIKNVRQLPLDCCGTVGALKVACLDFIDDRVIEDWAYNDQIVIFAYDTCKSLFENSAVHAAYERGREVYQQFTQMTYCGQYINPKIALDLMLTPYSCGEYLSHATKQLKHVPILNLPSEQVTLNRYKQDLYRFELHRNGQAQALKLEDNQLELDLSYDTKKM